YFDDGIKPAGNVKFSLREQVANILDDYYAEGDEYGSMRDVADGVEAIIAEAEEDTTSLENIVNAYRYAQEEARSWGDRMDAGGDDDFELTLRSYAYAGRERYSAREQEQPFGSVRAREEAIAMAERGDYASDIYRKTGWYYDAKSNNWRGTTRLHNDLYIEMRSKEEEAMPFFEDGGDETYIWGDISEEIVESATYKSSEERILAHMKNRHLVARERIRQAAKEDIDNTRRIYNEANLKRNEGLGKRTTNAGKVAYILGDTTPESLSLYDQALVKIALGEVHISWDDIGNKRGLASELGLKNGEKRSYSNITKGATMGLEEFVHGWWQELGGYEKDIDTQDLRNALIEALGEVNRPTQALAALRQKFDTALAERDAVIDRLEFDMEQALLAEDERYNNEVEGFKTSEEKNKYIKDYERDVMLIDASEAMRGTISDMDKALADAKARLEASTTHSASIRGKLGATTRSYNSLKRFADAIEEVKGKIREVVNNSAVLLFRRREINLLLDNLDKARSMEDIEFVSNRLQRLLLNISIRQEKANLNRLLNLRLPNGQFAEAWINNQIASGAISAADGKRILADMWRGTNNKGIRVARYVDGDTGAMLRYLRNSLIAPNARRFYEKVTDANGNVVLNEEGKPTKVLSPDLELAINVKKERENTEQRINEITVYLESGLTGNNQEKFELKTAMEYKGRELKPAYIVPPKIEREALYRYLQYLDLVEEKKTMADLRKEMDKMSKVLWYDDNVTPKQKEEARTRLKTAFGALNASKMMYDNNLKEFNDSLAYLISSGRDAYKAFRDAQEEHRKEVVSEAVKAIGGEARLQPKSPTTMQNFKAKRWRGLLNNTYYSFQTVLKDIDRYAPNGEGAFYNRYMNGATKANQTFIAMENTHFVMLADKVNKLWDEEFKNSNPFVSLMALKNVMEATRVGSITYKPKFNPDTDEYEGEESFPLVVPNAMYILALWWQPRYATGYARRGITEAQIEVIKQELNAIDPRLIKLMEWIRDEFLPGTRLEYNEVYRQIFGVDMDREINYFPGNVVGRYEEVDVTSDTALNNNNGSTPKAIKARVDHTLMGDMAKNYFDVLIQHLQSMDYFYAYEQLRNDVNLVSSSAEFRGRLAAYKPGYKDAVHGEGGLFWLWRNTANIMLDQYRPVNNKNDDLFFALQKGWATSNISFKAYTALKQLASMPVFAAYSLDPECAKIFFREIKNVTSAIVRGHGKALYRATAAQFPTFRQRWTDRNAGIEWLAREGELNNANVNFERSKHPDLLVAADVLDRAINKLAIEWGMYPNALIDSLSVIVGLRTVDAFERYRMEKVKGSLTDEDIELAKIKAQIAINETQQSAEGAYLSVMQKDPGALWKPAVMYLNNTFANHRKRLAGLTELYRQWFDKEWRKEMERRYGDELGVVLKSARKKAYADIMQGVISDVNFYILTAAGVLVPMWLNGDDDEERSAGSIWKETGISLLGNVLIGGFVGGNIVTGLISGYTPSPIPSWDELMRGGKKFISEIRNDRWGAATYLAFEMLMQNAVGVDLDTFANVVIGAQELLRGEGTVGMMKILNIPQSQVELIVGKKREGETVIEYINRRLRAETILRYSYEDIYTKSGKRTGVKPILMSTYTLNKLLSDYETAYRRQVVIREEGRSGWNDMLKIDEEYKDVVKAIGWTAEKNPNNKAFESGEYEAPIEGMTRKQYDEAAKLEKKIASRARKIESFVGTDEKYYSLVKEMTEYKKQLIDNYNELE
ncbi:MAG: hypothetical protein IKL43_05950, partial [Alistipes sp.]|nr:hypothetical protein [Alistipes sp.]